MASSGSFEEAMQSVTVGVPVVASLTLVVPIVVCWAIGGLCYGISAAQGKLKLADDATGDLSELAKDKDQYARAIAGLWGLYIGGFVWMILFVGMCIATGVLFVRAYSVGNTSQKAGTIRPIVAFFGIVGIYVIGVLVLFVLVIICAAKKPTSDEELNEIQPTSHNVMLDKNCFERFRFSLNYTQCGWGAMLWVSPPLWLIYLVMSCLGFCVCHKIVKTRGGDSDDGDYSAGSDTS